MLMKIDRSPKIRLTQSSTILLVVVASISVLLGAVVFSDSLLELFKSRIG